MIFLTTSRSKEITQFKRSLFGKMNSLTTNLTKAINDSYNVWVNAIQYRVGDS